jgi:immune inhibitor A
MSDDSILSFTVDLTGATTATLRWWEWFDVFLNFDWSEVYVNGVVVFQHCGGSYVSPTEWEEQAIDLSSYVGGPVTISFHMMSSSVVNFAGWYIDDVQVVAETSEPAAIPTLSEWGMIIMSLMLAGSAFWMIRRRQVS